MEHEKQIVQKWYLRVLAKLTREQKSSLMERLQDQARVMDGRFSKQTVVRLMEVGLRGFQVKRRW